MNLILQIWRQENAQTKGKIVEYPIQDISPDMSFLEMLDILNRQLITNGDNPVAFDHDCREGICSKRFNEYCITIFKLSHVELTGCYTTVRPMGLSIDVQ